MYIGRIINIWQIRMYMYYITCEIMFMRIEKYCTVLVVTGNWALLTLVFVGELYESSGQVPASIETHYFSFNIPWRCLVQFLDTTNLVRWCGRSLEINVICTHTHTVFSIQYYYTRLKFFFFTVVRYLHSTNWIWSLLSIKIQKCIGKNLWSEQFQLAD